MKKLLIIVVAICTLHVNFAQGMFSVGENLKAAVHYADKWINPEGYVLDSQNSKLYQSILDAFNQKDISELRVAQFKNPDDVLHTLETTLGKRVAERLSTLITCLIQQSLIQDPIKRDDTKLSDMIKVNRLIIPDLYLALALCALQEQKHPKEPVCDTGSLIVDVLLHKIGLLAEPEKFLLRSKLEEDSKLITVDQKRNLAETYFLSLPETEQEVLLQKMSRKKPVSLPVPINHNASNKSLATTPTQNLQEDEQADVSSQKSKKRMALEPNKSLSGNEQVVNKMLTIMNDLDNDNYDGSNVIGDNKLLDAHNEAAGEVYEG